MDQFPDPWEIIQHALATEAAGHDLSSEQEDVLRLACEVALVSTFVAQGLPTEGIIEALDTRSHRIDIIYDVGKSLKLHIEWTEPERPAL